MNGTIIGISVFVFGLLIIFLMDTLPIVLFAKYQKREQELEKLRLQKRNKRG